MSHAPTLQRSYLKKLAYISLINRQSPNLSLKKPLILNLRKVKSRKKKTGTSSVTPFVAPLVAPSVTPSVKVGMLGKRTQKKGGGTLPKQANSRKKKTGAPSVSPSVAPSVKVGPLDKGTQKRDGVTRINAPVWEKNLYLKNF